MKKFKAFLAALFTTGVLVCSTGCANSKAIAVTGYNGNQDHYVKVTEPLYLELREDGYIYYVKPEQRYEVPTIFGSPEQDEEFLLRSLNNAFGEGLVEHVKFIYGVDNMIAIWKSSAAWNLVEPFYNMNYTDETARRINIRTSYTFYDPYIKTLYIDMDSINYDLSSDYYNSPWLMFSYEYAKSEGISTKPKMSANTYADTFADQVSWMAFYQMLAYTYDHNIVTGNTLFTGLNHKKEPGRTIAQYSDGNKVTEKFALRTYVDTRDWD